MTGILGTASIDTAMLPAAERFDFWQELVARESAPARVDSPHAHDFTASARVVDLGTVKLSSWRYPSLDMRRTARHIRRSDPEMYHLALPLSGHGAMIQDRRETRLGPHGFAFVHTGRPHGSWHRPDGPTAGPLSTVTALVPPAALPIPARRADRLLAAEIPAGAGMGLLLAQFIRQVVGHPEQYAPADAVRLDTVALDLVAGTLAQRLDIEETLPTEVRATGLRAGVEAFVERHLGDPELRPATVATAHHVSLRTLHRLFEDADTTVAALIRNRRLARCHRDLADERLRGLSVRTVAARWGFRDSAHFSRVFRARYGFSPQEHRDRSMPRRPR
ncbi:helix-turn-helix domain-containing protein [Micromonospora sp. C28SCA-DRY-2]|uniref:AraC-like ligand-binding domain-containing protein n=1 Tax=Micromonospora sp. C28SCA-DRY-2 TaxID=3059522 RepID=UPI002676A782|nr:helix-turn-helix domain-containing protein [Micromonospora sp. C28SCA-DRY-2]MDO3704591.1 helix-turn-helix domain-containing protein [Micromonospora sp. C28SCA-DRY-2]